jgi:hypothetical protein
MAGLVIGYLFLLILIQIQSLLQTSQNPVWGLLEILRVNMLSIFSDSKNSRLIAKIGKISTAKPVCQGGQSACIVYQWLPWWQFYLIEVKLQNFLSALDIRKLNLYQSVEPPRSSECIIQHLFSIGRCQNDDIVSCSKPIHLNKKLIEGVRSFIVRSAKFIVSLPAYRVDLVDKNYCRGLLLSVSE